VTLATRDPYAIPGGVIHTRIERPNRVQGWQDDHFDDYQVATGLNNSALKVLCTQTPAHFKHALSNPREDTPALRWGRIVHEFVLDGTVPKVMPSFKGKGSREAKAQWLEANGSQNCVDTEELIALEAIAKAIHMHPHAAGALARGRTEISGYAQTERFAVKMRADILVPDEGLIYDLKTCTDASPAAFAKDAWSFGYHIQAAWYLTVANLIEPGKYQGFRFIAVEKDAPYGVAVYEASPDLIAAGTAAIERAIDVLTRCMDEGKWPGLSQEVAQLELPAWALKKQSQGVFE
jgi:hypothetical protein